MGTSRLYEVPDSARELIRHATTKDEWYEALGGMDLEKASTLNGEDSFVSWEYALADAKLASPVGALFYGEFRAITDNGFDPHVVFHGSASVKAIASDFQARGRSFFADIFAPRTDRAEIWAYEAMTKFFVEAAEHGSAIIVLWGH